MVKRQSHKLVTIVCSLLLLPFVAHSGTPYTDIVPVLLPAENNANILLLDANQQFIQEYILLHNAYEPQNGNEDRRKKYKCLKKKMFLKYHPDKYTEPNQKKQAQNLSVLLYALIDKFENQKNDIFTFPDTLMPQIYCGLIRPLYNFHLYAGAITGAACTSRTVSAFNEAFNLGDNNQAVKASLKTSLSNLDKVFTQMTQNQKKRYLQQKQHLVSILK